MIAFLLMGCQAVLSGALLFAAYAKARQPDVLAAVLRAVGHMYGDRYVHSSAHTYSIRDIPGAIIVELREVPPHMRGHGFTLAKLRAWLGGDEGYITDPYCGERHLVSLKPWLQTNPDVELALFFDFIFNQDYVRQHPELFPPPPARVPAFIRDTRRKEDDIILIDRKHSCQGNLQSYWNVPGALERYASLRCDPSREQGCRAFGCTTRTGRPQWNERSVLWRAKMGTQRIFGRTLLLSVLVCALAVSTSIPAKAQQPVSNDIRDAVVGAVTAFKGAAPRYGTFINVIAVDRQNQWAYGTIALLTPKNQDAQNGSEDLPEGFIWLARRSGVNWEVAFEYTPTFLDWAAIAPSEVLDSNARSLFLSARVQPQTASHDNMTIQAAGDPGGNLALPWWPGQAWNFRGGPHGWSGSARPWSSLDFSGGDGKVLAARSGQAYRMCGNTTWIRVVHADGWATDYYHLVNLAVGNNVPVNYLQYLGDIGTAVDCGGSASSAHVHFAIRLNGSYIEWNGREIGGWTIYEGSSAYQGKAERSFVGGNTVVNVNSTIYNIGVQYQAHVQNIGWQPAHANGGTAGTVGQNLRMEAINISLLKPPGTPGNVDICYEAHVQNIGWQGERCNAQTAGTIGQSLRIEAIKIRLVNPPNRASVCYRAYVEGIGWQPWYCDNVVAGTTGQGRRLEALQILIMPASLP